MTDYQKYINALRKCAKEHDNDITSTGQIIVSDLCRDTANLLEALEQEQKTKFEELDFVQEHKKTPVTLDLTPCDEYGNYRYPSDIELSEPNTATSIPCGDAISRQAVDVLVDELARAISDERCCISRGRSTATIMQDILDLPSVNPQELKTGHWVENTSKYSYIYYRCSECGSMHLSKTNYCDQCGARMIEPQGRSEE